MAQQEEANKALVKELLEGLSDAAVRTLCIDALRIWRRKHPGEGQFSVHGALGRELVPILLARQGHGPIDSETLNGLKEPFITEQNQPWFVAVSDFLGWFVRAGYGDANSWERQNVVGIRLTRPGLKFLDEVETPSIEDDATTALLALADYGKSPSDPDRGRYALDGAELEKATALDASRLNDAVEILDSSGYVEIRKFIGTHPYEFGSVHVTAQGRREAQRLGRPVAPDQSGDAVASTKYQCMERLGEGAYGEAWRGRDVELQRDVAIKFVRSTGTTRQDVLEQARAIARVTNPSIIGVFEVTKVLDPKSNTVLDAVVMELAEGVSLVERLGTDLNRADALRIGTAILDAVAAYHSRGLVHLDLHDGNVIVGEQYVKIIDPMYFETTAMRSSKTRETQQQREIRRARDILIDLLHVAGVPPQDVARFEREVAKPDIERLRREFQAALDRPPAGAAVPA